MGRELPILFNTGRVQDILDDRKKATRRIIKFPVNSFTNELPKAQHVKVYGDTLYGETVQFYEEPFYSFYVKPPYRTGDILYVRESWCKDVRRYMYRADYDDNKKFYRNGNEVLIKWHPSIHMPKEAARIWLEVTDVLVERLQNMTLDDFLNEGVVLRPEAFNNPKNAYRQALEIFKDIWNSTIPKAKLQEYGWDANPWVWAIEFERREKPEPCILKGLEPAEDKRPCIGYAKNNIDDEPCEMCKGCNQCTGNDEFEQCDKPAAGLQGTGGISWQGQK